MQSKHRYLHRLYHKRQHRNTNVNNSSNTRFNYHIIHNLSEYTGCFTMRMMTQIYLGTAIEKKLKKTTTTNYKKKRTNTKKWFDPYLPVCLQVCSTDYKKRTENLAADHSTESWS